MCQTRRNKEIEKILLGLYEFKDSKCFTIWEHFKTGREYKILCIATKDSSLQPVVIYYNSDLKCFSTPLECFCKEVYIDGKWESRFRLTLKLEGW